MPLGSDVGGETGPDVGKPEPALNPALKEPEWMIFLCCWLQGISWMTFFALFVLLFVRVELERDRELLDPAGTGPFGDCGMLVPFSSMGMASSIVFIK